MAKLEVVEGIGSVFAQKLRAAGILTTEALLQAGATPKGRKDLVDKTGIGPEYIPDWVNRVDLRRVKGLGAEYTDLLERAGVDTVVELAQRNPETLHATMLEVNAEKLLVRRVPALGMVADWVGQAKKLKRIVSY